VEVFIKRKMDDMLVQQNYANSTK